MYDRIHIQVSMAVLLIDDFTDRIVTSSALRVSVQNGGKPIKKEGGFHVFTNIAASAAQVTVEGPGYCREVQTVDLETLNRTNPVVRIRVKPDRTYALPDNAVRVLALLPSHAVLSIFDEEGSDYKRLLTDYEKGSGEISLYQDGSRELEGKTCCVVDKNHQYELIRLGSLKDRETGTFSLEQEPKSSHKKADTKIYPVSLVGGEQEAEYFLPLQSDAGEEVHYTCILQQGDTLTQTQVTLKSGRENRLDFRGDDRKMKGAGKNVRRRPAKEK